MNTLFEKIREIEREISDEVGGLILFGLFKPEETPYWDVVVSADWVDPQSSPAIRYVVGKLQQRLSREQMLTLSKVVPLSPSEEFVQAVLRKVRVDHGNLELEHRIFNGLDFREAYIVTANPENKPHAPLPVETAPPGARAGSAGRATKAGRQREVSQKARDR